MSVDLNIMRRNWRIVERFWLEVDEWPPSDVSDAKNSIKKAVENHDDQLIECWFNYLAEIIALIKLSPWVIEALDSERDSNVSTTV